MLQISLKNGRKAFHLCLFCGRKVHPHHHRKGLFHVVKTNAFGGVGHSRCYYSTKIIRGCSDGSRCEVRYTNSPKRHVKGILDVVANSYFNNSLAEYLVLPLKKAASLNEASIFYFKQNLQSASGATYSSSTSTPDQRNKNSEKDSNQEYSEEQYTIWNSVKVGV